MGIIAQHFPVPSPSDLNSSDDTHVTNSRMIKALDAQWMPNRWPCVYAKEGWRFQGDMTGHSPGLSPVQP